MKKGIKKEIFRKAKKHATLLYCWYILIGVGFLVSGAYMFNIGYHYIDFGWNLRYLSSEFNTSLYDKASDGNIYSGSELIQIGNSQMRRSFFTELYGAFILGVCLTGIFYERKKYLK